MTEQSQNEWLERLKGFMEVARQRINLAMDTPAAKDLGNRLSNLGDEVNNAIKSPRSREVMDRIDKEMKELGTDIDRVLKSQPAANIKNDLSDIFKDLGREINEAIDSDTGRDVRHKVGNFLEDIATRIKDSGEKKA
jgi:gas vesicle protein